METVLAKLGNGVDTQVLTSELTTITTFMETFIVAPRMISYGGKDWLRQTAAKHHMHAAFLGPTNMNALDDSVKLNKTSLVWVESPVIPTWDVIDIKRAA